MKRYTPGPLGQPPSPSRSLALGEDDAVVAAPLGHRDGPGAIGWLLSVSTLLWVITSLARHRIEEGRVHLLERHVTV